MIAGKARVVDGDTLVVGSERIRLYGVDAPESKQICRRAALPSPACSLPNSSFMLTRRNRRLAHTNRRFHRLRGSDWLCGKAAAEALQKELDRVGGGTVKCTVMNSDMYGRCAA